MRPDSEGFYNVVSPRGESRVEKAPAARRLSDLSGKRVVQLWDYIFRGDEIYSMLEGELSSRYPGIEFVSWREFGNTHGEDEVALLEGLPQKLKEFGADAVISGVGACGSCTPAVIRAAVVAEKAGIPSVSVITEGFVRQAQTTLVGMGVPNTPLAVLPGHIGVQSRDELRGHVVSGLLDQVVTAWTHQPDEIVAEEEATSDGIVFSGTYAEVNAYFYQKEWSDGLPIVPPTINAVNAFLQFTDRKPDEVLGVLPPDNRAATVWTVAVNGVLAGCRPEYMPILIAIVEAMADQDYRVESSSNTPGAETLIILNGPIARQLGFNYEQGVLRDGFQANTSVGRFFRLMLRNVCGFLLHKTDKGCFGGTWRVVMPENDDVLRKLGWDPISVEMGMGREDNAVTIARFTGGDVMISATGDTPEQFMPYLADAAARLSSWQLTFTVGAMSRGMLRPLMVITPVLAEVFAKNGWSKHDIKQYLFDHARIPAWKYENYIKNWSETTKYTLKELVRFGDAPKMFHESSDPERMLPIVCEPDDFLVAVSGDPLRTNVQFLTHNGSIGYTVCKKITLPSNWDSLVAVAGARASGSTVN